MERMNGDGMSFKRILITGGGGYVGAVLVPCLLRQGYHVTVLDLLIYGEDVLPDHPALKVIKGDIRDLPLLEKTLENMDAVIHLACISNDPSFELNPELGRSINLEAFRPLVEASVKAGVKRFVYASSSSVYGIKKERDVHETMPLEPLTDYSRFKADCERILAEYQTDNFTTVTLRPATVCGYSPRQRLDLVVNIFANLAYHNREITVFGGDQLRPNIHIQDIVDCYCMILQQPADAVAGEVFNVGDANYSVRNLAEFARDVMGDDVTLVTTPSDDDRSYHISSSKIKSKLGFTPSHGISKAIVELKKAFEEGRFSDPLNNEMYFNVKRMNAIRLT